MAPEPAVHSGLTFADRPGRLYAPLRRTLKVLGLSVGYVGGRPIVEWQPLAKRGPALPDGTRLIPLSELRRWEVTVEWDPGSNLAKLSRKGKRLSIRRGRKSVEIDKSRQLLIARQGGLVVLRSPVSTGMEGKATPNGKFEAGPYKAKMHRSRLYHNAPMPYSMQIEGDIFVHGYASVPDRPASHGCIRLPLNGSAEFFYDWVSVGTPVAIHGEWKR